MTRGETVHALNEVEDYLARAVHCFERAQRCAASADPVIAVPLIAEIDAALLSAESVRGGVIVTQGEL